MHMNEQCICILHESHWLCIFPFIQVPVVHHWGMMAERVSCAHCFEFISTENSVFPFTIYINYSRVRRLPINPQSWLVQLFLLQFVRWLRAKSIPFHIPNQVAAEYRKKYPLFVAAPASNQWIRTLTVWKMEPVNHISFSGYRGYPIQCSVA